MAFPRPGEEQAWGKCWTRCGGGNDSASGYFLVEVGHTASRAPGFQASPPTPLAWS